MDVFKENFRNIVYYGSEIFNYKRGAEGIRSQPVTIIRCLP